MPKLYIENGADRGKSYLIQKDGPFFAGRDKAAQVVLLDEMASRRHFQIEHRKTKFFLRDLDSSNGTFLNGSLVRGVEPLAPNDRIQIGSTLITFQTDEPHPLIGREISGYRILDRIGRGGMGTVYRALQTSLDRMVALKVLAPHLVKNTNFVNLFIREARSAGALSHPNIVQVYDVGVQDDIYFFSMEYIQDGSVEDLLNRHGPVPLARALRLVNDAAKGLEYAEQVGIIHRDIKPGNLMIGSGGVVKIGDLGISRTTEGGAQASQKDGVSGSPHYIAPEQAKGFDIDSRVDIYSLGCSFYQMLSGSTPFRGSTPREVILKHLKEEPQPIADRVEGLPNDVARVVHHMMAKNAAERVRGAGPLIELLEPLLRKYPDDSAGETIPAKRFGIGRIFALVSTVVILVGVGVGFMILKVQHDQRIERETQRRNAAAIAIDDLQRFVRNADNSGFQSRFESLDRDRFNEEEWEKVDQARRDSDRIAATQAQEALLATARRQFAAMIQRGTEQMQEARETDWEQRVALMETLAKEVRKFNESYEDLESEEIRNEALAHAEDLERQSKSLRNHEETAIEELDRFRPRAEGFAGAGNFKSARKELEKFNVEKYANTSAHRQQLEALEVLNRTEGVKCEQQEKEIAAQVDRKEFSSALSSLQRFRKFVAFENTLTKIDARITEIQALQGAASSSPGDGEDRTKVEQGITSAWKTWASKLALSSRELGTLRDLRRDVRSLELKEFISEQADLLDLWDDVGRGLDGKELPRHRLGLPRGDLSVIDLRLDGDKIRYTNGNTQYFSRWPELSDEGRVRLLTAIASRSKEKLFAGLLALALGRSTPDSNAAWSTALADPSLAEIQESVQALADLLDE